VTEQLLAQQLESPSGTGRVDPGSPQPCTHPTNRRGMHAVDNRILTGQSARVSDPTAEEQLAEIERLLDDGVGRQNLEDLTLVQRVQDVIAAFNSWSDLAIKRLQ